MNMMKMCLNWKVVGALAAVALGVWLLAPSVVGAVLPLLVFAACPLSMLVMMWAMRRGMSDEQCSPEPNGRQAEAGSGTREERLAELRTSLSDVRSQEQAIERAPITNPFGHGGEQHAKESR